MKSFQIDSLPSIFHRNKPKFVVTSNVEIRNIFFIGIRSLQLISTLFELCRLPHIFDHLLEEVHLLPLAVVLYDSPMLKKFWCQCCGRSSSSNVISSQSAASPSNVFSSEYASPSSSVSDTIQNQDYKYDVFISFRGPDTRNSFVDHVCSHLLRKGIFVFKDDHKLRKGESISSQLPEAIRSSRISIIVFSQDYPSSLWCLDEMATIASCQQQSNQTVFPVFYHVDPSHVRHQNGVYEKAFHSLRQKFKGHPDKVYRWERAMNGIGKLAGWDVRNKYVLIVSVFYIYTSYICIILI